MIQAVTVSRMPQPRGRFAAGVEVGTTLPNGIAGNTYNDFLPQLRGRRAQQVYQEMGWNDATIGAVLYTIEQLCRSVDWQVESDDEQAKQFLSDNIEGLSHPWSEFIAGAVSMVQYGWSMYEIVYRLDEGRIWWDRFAFRPQETLHDWVLAPNGDLLAFQQSTRGGGTVTIPAEKLIHFRTNTVDGRPEGRSWLRRAYRAWYLKKRAEDVTAVGIDRDLNGIPKAEIPSDILLAGSGDPVYDAVKKIVTGVKQDEYAGIMWPSDIDPDTQQKLFDFSLLSTSGRPKTDPLQFIRAQAQDIAGVMLAQFISLGRDTVGSRALAEPQQEIFQTALGALLDAVEEQFHRQATQPLLEINNLPSARVVHGELRDLDLEGIGNFLLRTAQAGADYFPPDDPTAVDELREMAGLAPVESVMIEDENVEPRRGSLFEE